MRRQATVTVSLGWYIRVLFLHGRGYRSLCRQYGRLVVDKALRA